MKTEREIQCRKNDYIYKFLIYANTGNKILLYFTRICKKIIDKNCIN